MAPAATEWTDFGWQGICLRIPGDWNLGRVDGDRDKGYARLDDAEIVRAEVEWRALGPREGSVRVEDLVDRYIGNLKKKADKAGAPFSVERRAKFLKNKKWLEGCDYEAFTWEADFRAYNLARTFPGSRRVLLLRVLCHFDENRVDEVEAIFRSLEEGGADGALLWSVYGMRFLMPAEFRLREHALRSGHIQLSFEEGKQTCHVHRLSLARMLLRGTTLKDWYANFFKKQLRDLSVEIEQGEVGGHRGLCVQCRPKPRWRQLLKPLPWINPRPRLFVETRVWHREDTDKICIVDHLYRKKDGRGDLLEKIVDGYLKQEQRTEAEPGRHAGVAADAK